MKCSKCLANLDCLLDTYEKVDSKVIAKFGPIESAVYFLRWICPVCGTTNEQQIPRAAIVGA